MLLIVHIVETLLLNPIVMGGWLTMFVLLSVLTVIVFHIQGRTLPRTLSFWSSVLFAALWLTFLVGFVHFMLTSPG